MEKKLDRKILSYAVALSLSLGISACSDNDEPNNGTPEPEPMEASVGAFILNQGTQGYNIPGSLTYYDYESGLAEEDVFKKANNRVLGSTPQCGIRYGSMIYVGDSQSNTIEIMDAATFKSHVTLHLDNAEASQPRSMVAAEGKIYISMYTGHVCRLDTASLTIDATLKVGPNPERMAIRGRYLYVPNSDGMNWMEGYGTTATKININDFTVEKTFTVGLNPTDFITNGIELFLICMGDYMDVPSQVYIVNADDTVTAIAEANLAAAHAGKLYYINAPWNATTPECYAYDIAAKKSEPFLAGNFVDHPAAIGVDPVAEVIVVTSNTLNNGYADYSIPGYANFYTLAGEKIGTCATGVNPNAVFF